MHVADAADLADAERAADVGVAEVDVVEGALGALGQIHDIAVGPVDRSVGRLEIEDAVDIAVGVEGQALDPVLRVVGEEVAALVAARELGAVIDESAGDGRVAPVVRIVVEREPCRRDCRSAPRRSASRSLRRARRYSLPRWRSSRSLPPTSPMISRPVGAS